MAEEMNDEETGTAVAESEAPASEAKPRLNQDVEVNDIGPCKKHIKVTVHRGDIDELLNEKFSDLVLKNQSSIRGFRPGKAPRKIVERLYKDDVYNQVRG